MALPIYADLNIPYQSAGSIQEVLDLCVDVGFERVAINNVVKNLQSGKNKKQAAKPQILPPTQILLNKSSTDALKAQRPKFQQLSRFTTILDDAANTHRLGSPEVQAYDIIAVQPTDEKTFQLACSTLDVDIICLNFTENLGFSLKRPLIKLAIKRGIHFEISYSPALKDNSVKRNIISNALTLISVSRGKGVIISSAAEKPIDVRSPWDVMNLGKLFGLNQTQAKDAISRNCRAVLKHAEARKTCKTVISVTAASNLRPDERWILQTSRTEAISQQKSITQDNPESSSEEDSSDDSEDNENMDSENVHDQPERKKLKLDVS
ncbi:ribonuclease p protein subunit p30 [Plakobranchus ocellatus]|uniref:Ribonuclease p protein subunit p30 n=1 Tax=Plakobranchus ocellatus TaxID=259542 RepID=A0AAV4AWI1_9GAST|nr:ribonuclease p protein subunit p30 [Plakobranchus ocellatus]